VLPFKPQELSTSAWSIANLRFLDVPLLNATAAAAMATIAEFGAQEFSNLAWSFSTLTLQQTPVTEWAVIVV